MVLGYHYSHGIMVPKDCEKALYHYHQVAWKIARDFKRTSSIPINRLRLAKTAKSPSGPTVSEEDILHYYKYAADQGDITAQVSDKKMGEKRMGDLSSRVVVFVLFFTTSLMNPSLLSSCFPIPSDLPRDVISSMEIGRDFIDFSFFSYSRSS
jgi:TPR repeat protein